MYLIDEVVKKDTDLKESMIVSDMMEEFPPISKEDHPVVIAEYASWYFKETDRVIDIDHLPDTIAGIPLRIVSKKRKSNKNSSEAIEEETS